MTVPGSATGSRVTPGTKPDESTREGHTALYRFFDAPGLLLYVGITNQLAKRFQQHSSSARWWSAAASHSVEWLPSRTAAGRAERAAIRNEKPLHNVLHTPRSRVPLRQRLRKDLPSASFGDSLLEVLQDNFRDYPFTASDALAVASMSGSGVQKSLRALAERREIIIVGSRHEVTEGGPRRDSALYLLPVHEWIDAETKKPIPPSLIPDNQPSVREQPAFVPRPRDETSNSPRPAFAGQLPPVVTFSSGAQLLMDLGLVDTITREGVRRISKEAGWPFGPGKSHSYGKAGTATTMETEAFLEFFRKGPRRGGRGRYVPPPTILPYGITHTPGGAL